MTFGQWYWNHYPARWQGVYHWLWPERNKMKPSIDQFAFRSFVGRLWTRIVSNLIQAKGQQYTNESNAFENFEHSASAWDTHVPYEILQMAQKHWTFLVRWAKIGAPRDEFMGRKARESAWDITVYLLLLLFWLQTEGVISVEEETVDIEEIKKKHRETSPLPDDHSPNMGKVSGDTRLLRG